MGSKVVSLQPLKSQPSLSAHTGHEEDPPPSPQAQGSNPRRSGRMYQPRCPGMSWPYAGAHIHIWVQGPNASSPLPTTTSSVSAGSARHSIPLSSHGPRLPRLPRQDGRHPAPDGTVQR